MSVEYNDTIDMQSVESILNKTFKSKVTNILEICILQENVKTDPPSDGSEYIAFTVNYGLPVKDARGVWIRDGIATAQIFTPLGNGTGRGIEIGETIRKAFQGAEWAARVLTVSSVQINKIGVSGGMYQTNADISFQYYESDT